METTAFLLQMQAGRLEQAEQLHQALDRYHQMLQKRVQSLRQTMQHQQQARQQQVAQMNQKTQQFLQATQDHRVAVQQQQVEELAQFMQQLHTEVADYLALLQKQRQAHPNQCQRCSTTVDRNEQNRCKGCSISCLSSARICNSSIGICMNLFLVPETSSFLDICLL